MNTAKHQRWLAGALCLALTACSSMERDRNTAGTSSDGSGSMASAASSPDSGSGAMRNSGTASTPATTASSAVQTSYGTVQAVDPMQRQDVGVGTLGAAAAGGTMGAPTDRVYRVTVRMDDGTSQTIVVDSKPSYMSGDRVRYSNGTLEKY